MTLLASHQPNFIPWTGYFEKWSHSDVFVHMDEVEFSRGSYTNRTRVPSPGGVERWLTVPVQARIQDPIWAVTTRIRNSGRRKILGSLNQLSRQFKYRKDLIGLLDLIDELLQDGESLADLNISINDYLAAALSIQTPSLRASQVDLPRNAKSQRLVSYCKAFNASAYLAGQGSDSYLQDRMFAANGLKVFREVYTGTLGLPEAIRGLSVFIAVGHLGVRGLGDLLAGDPLQ